MNITLDRALLIEAIHRCLPATDARSPLPMADKILLDAVGDGNPRLLLSASCGTLSISTAIPVKTCATSGAALVQAKKLYGLLGSLHGEQVTLKKGRTTQLIVQGNGKRKFEQQFLDPELFHKLSEPSPNLTQIKIQSDQLKSILKALKFAANNPSRPHIHGVMLHGDSTTLTAIATDGHTMAVKRVPCQDQFELFLPGTILVPLLELTEHNSAIMVCIDGRTVYAETDVGDTLISTALPSEAFVPWKIVLANLKLSLQCTVSASALQDTLKAILVARSGSDGAAKFTLKSGQLQIGLNLQQVGAIDVIEVTGAGEFDMLLDPDLVLEASKPCGDNIEMFIDSEYGLQLVSPTAGYSALVVHMTNPQKEN